MAQLEISSVSKAFGDVSVLSAVSLSVEAGELVTLLGPSGCGKSTLLRIIAGLETADGGQLRIAGKDVRAMPAKERNVAMVFQNLALYPQLTARENIALPLRVRRLSHSQRMLGRLHPGGSARRIAREIDADVARLAASLGIETFLHRKPAALSGGQRQRVALARALIRESGLLLMDEPLSSLDAKLRVQARDEIVQIQRKFGVACIFVTHDQAEALAISDRVVVMLRGKIAQCGAPAAIYHDPQTLEVAQFVGTPSINCLEGTVDRDGWLSIEGRPVGQRHRDLAGQRVQVAARPENVSLMPPAHPSASPRSVVRVEDQGADLFVHLARPDGLTGMVVARLPPHRRPKPGDRFGIAFDPAHTLVFDAHGCRHRATQSEKVVPIHA
jgi:multiple sugar transport system ATP-binding protein